MKAATKDTQSQIIKGLLKCMTPMEALVMTAMYQQFPVRFIPKNSYYFPPSVDQIRRALAIKEPVVQLMLHRLVDSGYLEKRKAKSGGMEYRIVFDKLRPFLEENGKT